MVSGSRQAGLLVGNRLTRAVLTRASWKQAPEPVQHHEDSPRFSRVRACDGPGRAELGAAHDKEACVRLGDYRGVVHRPLPHRVPPPGVAGPQGARPTAERVCPQPALAHDQELAAGLSLDRNPAARRHRYLVHVLKKGAQLRVRAVGQLSGRAKSPKAGVECANVAATACFGKAAASLSRGGGGAKGAEQSHGGQSQQSTFGLGTGTVAS